jgi:hypothetical protein
LLYADDIVLISENESDLQEMLNLLNSWCSTNKMFVNAKKSHIVHFRPMSVPISNFVFKCGEIVLEYSNRYVYLGLLLTEHLDLNSTAIMVAQSAGRALGLLIAKYKNLGGFPMMFTQNYIIQM